MKILLINPNSDPEMTATIQSAAEHFAAGEFEVVTELTPSAPRFIETYEDQVKAAAGMIQLVRDNESEYDAFINACHCDPNLDTLKEITKKPVVGIGEASMKLATMLGHRFSVVSTTSHSAPNKEALIRQYHLQDQLASVRSPADENLVCSLEEKFLEASRLAIGEDRAEVVVLGCACLAGIDKKLQEKLGVPVLDGVVCALIIAAGMVKYGVSTSKIRRYNPDY
ncbi:MAG: Asp/Glu/hydantoin racemase [Planctomycetes bacterium]|nr:Asp/Glu/hydantoin racemase [Planctomycetota bacterium]